MKNSYVKIKTLFVNDSERSIESLKKIYEDHSLLVKEVEQLCAEVFTANMMKGKKVLLKPNWVKHFFRPNDDICLCTHYGFLLAVLEVVLSKGPLSVTIGDAPIQGCKWDQLVNKDLVTKVKALADKYAINVTIKDFRRVAFDTEHNNVDVERNPLSEYVIFDVGKKSFLEPITHKKRNLFRVSQYNPDKFIETHRPGVHKYCITKELFNADIVISLPKIKTHQKAGITCALKNIVGLNGDKDFLPHHRIGGTSMGGDSYPGGNILRYWSELALDTANRRKGKKSYWFWVRLSTVLWRISLPGKKHQLSAAWYGNDTTWRMVMDLNLVLNFGKIDGTLAESPQRFLYSFCDGIIGGQGDGPLRPDPLNLGVICFSNDSASTDLCMATLMGLQVERIPLLQAAKRFTEGVNPVFVLNGREITLRELKRYATNAIPSPGWQDYAQESA